jgi:site-specific recombinase XerD
MSIHGRKTKSGTRYDVRIRRPDGTQHFKSFKTRREAVAYQSAQVADRGRGQWVDDRRTKVTFSSYADIWLNNNPSKKTRTRDRDSGIIQKHLNPAIGSLLLGNIKHSQLQTLVNTWVSNGLSPSSIQRHVAVMRAIFTMAVRDEIIVRSPAVGLVRPRANVASGQYLSAEQATQLLAAVDPRYYAIVYVLLTTGIRWSELAGLNIRHFNPMSTCPTLSIVQGRHETSTGIEVTPTKSQAGRRELVLAPEQVEVIAKYLTVTGRTGANPDEPLFVSPMGKPLKYSNFRPRVWLLATRAAGLEGLRIHDLRKTAITNLIQAGVDIKTLTAVAGHEDVRTTLKHYAKTTPESLLGASQGLVAAIKTSESREAVS